jgi:hypothetical protein
MKAIEFETTIQDGVIRIPDPTLSDQPVRVIVLWEENSEPKRNYDPVKLDEALKKVVELNPFRDIEDPVEWQRRIRDEWD